jgi:hypothetical protein
MPLLQMNMVFFQGVITLNDILEALVGGKALILIKKSLN